MALDEDLRTEIIAASTTLGQRVHQSVVPEHQGNTFPRCWYQRTGTEDLLAADGSRIGLVWHEYTIECISASTDADAAISEATIAANSIRTNMNGKRGTFGNSTILGMFVEEQDDDYIPRGIGADEGAHVSALLVRIATT